MSDRHHQKMKFRSQGQRIAIALKTGTTGQT